MCLFVYQAGDLRRSVVDTVAPVVESVGCQQYFSTAADLLVDLIDANSPGDDDADDDDNDGHHGHHGVIMI